MNDFVMGGNRSFVYLKNIVTLSLDQVRCTGCGICIEVCPHEVFRVDGAKVSIVDRDQCMECGACALNCPFGALSVGAGVGCAKALIRGRAVGRQPQASCNKPASSEECSKGDC